MFSKDGILVLMAVIALTCAVAWRVNDTKISRQILMPEPEKTPDTPPVITLDNPGMIVPDQFIAAPNYAFLPPLLNPIDNRGTEPVA